jgi:hypothetical protein
MDAGTPSNGGGPGDVVLFDPDLELQVAVSNFLRFVPSSEGFLCTYFVTELPVPVPPSAGPSRFQPIHSQGSCPTVCDVARVSLYICCAND